MDPLIKFLPKSISKNTKYGPGGPSSIEVVCDVIGPIDTDYHRLMDEVFNNKKHLVLLNDREYAMMSSDSKKLSLILQEVLELKSLIRGDEC